MVPRLYMPQQAWCGLDGYTILRPFGAATAGGALELYAPFKQLGKLWCVHWAAEEVALALRAMMVLKVCSLFLCLDTLGNHEVFEILPHVNYCAGDRGVIRIASDLGDEGLINFQNVDRKLLQVAEAGIAGAKIVHRQLYPH